METNKVRYTGTIHRKRKIISTTCLKIVSSPLFKKTYLLKKTYFWLHWVSAVVVLSLVVSGDYSLFVVWGLLCCSGFSCPGACSLGTQALVVAAQWLSCSTACGIFPDQGLNQWLLHCKADYYKPDHQGSPSSPLIMGIFWTHDT